LTVVGDESLADGVRAGHERLEDLQSDGDDLRVASVQGSYTNNLGSDSNFFETVAIL
jgi:hypothetical protein